MKLYHTANPIDRQSIREKGIVPSVGEQRCFEYQDDLTPYIFLAREQWDSTWDDDIWEVEVDENLLSPDRNYEEWFTTIIPILSPKLIYEGTGISTL